MPYDETVAELGLDEYKYGFVTDDQPIFKSKKGLSEEVVRQISAHKEEPEEWEGFIARNYTYFDMLAPS